MASLGATLASVLSCAAVWLTAPGQSHEHGGSSARNAVERRVLPLPGFQGQARLPWAQLTLGSTASELASIAAECNREAGAEVCRPETFALELNAGTPVTVPSFFMDLQEVSVAAYDRCVRAGRCAAPLALPAGDESSNPLDLPVVGVSQRDASSYCAFMGGRLPQEQEFERAVRGPRRRAYPWGNLFHESRLNGGAWGAAQTNAADGFERLAPAGAFLDGRTPEGVLQLLGNAEEWTSSKVGDASSTTAASATASAATPSIVRGGHFADPPSRLRAAVRRFVPASSRRATLGFRCAKSDPRPAPRAPR